MPYNPKTLANLTPRYGNGSGGKGGKGGHHTLTKEERARGARTANAKRSEAASINRGIRENLQEECTDAAVLKKYKLPEGSLWRDVMVASVLYQAAKGNAKYMEMVLSAVGENADQLRMAQIAGDTDSPVTVSVVLADTSGERVEIITEAETPQIAPGAGK